GAAAHSPCTLRGTSAPSPLPRAARSPTERWGTSPLPPEAGGALCVAPAGVSRVVLMSCAPCVMTRLDSDQLPTASAHRLGDPRDNASARANQVVGVSRFNRVALGPKLEY